MEVGLFQTKSEAANVTAKIFLNITDQLFSMASMPKNCVKKSVSKEFFGKNCFNVFWRRAEIKAHLFGSA
jgi:hypothetical protein